MAGDKIDKKDLPCLNPHDSKNDREYLRINDKELNSNGANQFFRNVILRTKIYSCFNCKSRKTSTQKRSSVPVTCDVETYEDPSLASSSVSEEPTTPLHSSNNLTLTEDIPDLSITPKADTLNGSNIKHSESYSKLFEHPKDPIHFGVEFFPSFLNKDDFQSLSERQNDNSLTPPLNKHNFKSDDSNEPSFSTSDDQNQEVSQETNGLIPPLVEHNIKTDDSNEPSSSTSDDQNQEISDLSVIISQGQEVSQETNSCLKSDLNLDDDSLREDVGGGRPNVTFICSQEGASIDEMELTWKILSQNRKNRLKVKTKRQLKFRKVRRRAQLVFIIILSTATVHYYFLKKDSIPQSNRTQHNSNELSMANNGTALKHKLYPILSKKISKEENCENEALYLDHQDRAKVCFENMKGFL